MGNQTDVFELPELTLWDDEQMLDLTVKSNGHRAVAEPPSSKASGEDLFVSKLADVCADSDKHSLVDNLVKQTCGIAGFGPMVSALEKLRA